MPEWTHLVPDKLCLTHKNHIFSIAKFTKESMGGWTMVGVEQGTREEVYFLIIKYHFKK